MQTYGFSVNFHRIEGEKLWQTPNYGENTFAGDIICKHYRESMLKDSIFCNFKIRLYDSKVLGTKMGGFTEKSPFASCESVNPEVLQ